MSEIKGGSPQPCQCLRTKNPYGNIPVDSDAWLPGIASTSTYWCLRTMGPAGPDENFVHLSRCTPSRSCYESMDQ